MPRGTAGSLKTNPAKKTATTHSVNMHAYTTLPNPEADTKACGHARAISTATCTQTTHSGEQPHLHVQCTQSVAHFCPRDSEGRCTDTPGVVTNCLLRVSCPMQPTCQGALRGASKPIQPRKQQQHTASTCMPILPCPTLRLTLKHADMQEP